MQFAMKIGVRSHLALAIGLAGMGALVVAGCTVGPDFHKPQPKMPTTWASPTSQPTTQASALVPNLAKWWTSFNDPMLNSLIVRAAEGNLDLKQAEARIRQARAARGVAASALWPSVNTNASYSRTRSSAALTGGHSTGAHDLYQAGFDASWELDIFGGIRRNVEAADADIQSAIEDRRDVLVTLMSEVGINYMDLRGLQLQLQIAKANLAAQQRSLDLTQRRFQGGFVARLDVANAQAQVATTQSQIPPLETALQQTIYSLGVLLGLEPAALLSELSTQAPIPVTPPAVPVGLPSELLRRRPDIRRTEAQLHAATARIGVATADLFPRFSLTGSLGVQGNQLKQLGNWDNRFWSAGPAVSWPIFTAGRIESNIQVQTAVQEEVAAQYAKTVLGALQDVESSLIAYAKEQQHRQALAEAVAANRQAVDLAMQLYTQGQTDFLNVLSAQRALLLSEDALAQSVRAVSADLVSLYKALGGGWDMEAPPATQPATQPAKGH